MRAGLWLMIFALVAIAGAVASAVNTSTLSEDDSDACEAAPPFDGANGCGVWLTYFGGHCIRGERNAGRGCSPVVDPILLGLAAAAAVAFIVGATLAFVPDPKPEPQEVRVVS